MDVPTVLTSDELVGAATSLLVQNCVYKFPVNVKNDAEPGDQTEIGRQLAIALSLLEPGTGWHFCQSTSRILTPKDELGLHGNIFAPHESNDEIHFHQTLTNATTATFANATPTYVEAKDKGPIRQHLTELLREGKTDTRYIDPESVWQTTATAGEALAFRVADRKTRLPLMHDFVTIGDERETVIDLIVTERLEQETLRQLALRRAILGML